MKKTYLFIIAILFASYSTIKAQEQVDLLKENVVFNIDNFGDAHVETSWTFNASQWDNFKKIMGTNEDMLKRSMERSLPAYFLQNFKYKEDAMNRSYTLSFDALGLAKVNDNGNWEVDMDQKNPDVTKISDKNYAMTATFNSGGTLVQELIKLNIPDGASDITQSKDAFGKAIFVYTLTPAHKKLSFLFLALGILLIAGGVVLYLKPDLLKMKSKAVKYPFQPAAVVAPAQSITATEEGQNPAKTAS